MKFDRTEAAFEVRQRMGSSGSDEAYNAAASATTIDTTAKMALEDTEKAINKDELQPGSHDGKISGPSSTLLRHGYKKRGLRF